MFRLRFNQIAIVRTAAVTTLPSYRSPMHQLLVLRVRLSRIVDDVYSPSTEVEAKVLLRLRVVELAMLTVWHWCVFLHDALHEFRL